MMATILKVVARITKALKHKKLALHTCQILKTCSVEARDESSSTSSECEKAIAVVCFNWFIEVLFDRIIEAGRFLTGRWRWCFLASDASWEDGVGVRKPRVCGCPASGVGLWAIWFIIPHEDVWCWSGEISCHTPNVFPLERGWLPGDDFSSDRHSIQFLILTLSQPSIDQLFITKSKKSLLYLLGSLAGPRWAFDTYLSVELVCSMSLRSSKMPIPIHVSCIMIPSPCTRS